MRACFGVAVLALCVSVTATAAGQDDRVGRARALFQAGTEAFTEGDFRTAGQKFEQAYRLSPSAEMAFNVARAYERMSEYDKAVRYFRIYLRDVAEIEGSARRDIEQRIEALQAAQRRQREQVFTAPPTNDELAAEARTFFQRGVSMFQRRQYEAALQAFTAAHRFAPVAEVLYNLAVTCERLDRTRDAIDWYREYLRARPDSPDRSAIERKIDELRAQRDR